jgi:5-methylthioribose kinase
MNLDIEQTDDLIDYLRQRGLFGKGESCSAAVLRGGVSNKTVLVKGPTRSIVVKQALEKLRVATDWLADPARIEREAIGLRLLEQLAPAGSITPFVFEDGPLFLLGMEAVPDPHENWKAVLLRGEVADDAIRQFGALLGRIHFQGPKLDEESRRLIEDRRFFEELRVDPYYRFAAGNNPEAAEFYTQLIDDMTAAALTVVHGDFSPKNILVHQGRLILLDHEVIHWGDPTFDLALLSRICFPRRTICDQAGSCSCRRLENFGNPISPKPGRWRPIIILNRAPVARCWRACWRGWMAGRRSNISHRKSERPKKGPRLNSCGNLPFASTI